MKNKKYLTAVILAVLSMAAVFAEAGYKVKSVIGKVQYEAAPGTWKSVKKGQELSPSTVVNTGLDSKLILVFGDKTITIKQMQKGTIEKLALVLESGKDGIKKGVAVTKNNVNGDADGSTKGVATASSRASDAKEDLDWEEE